MGFEPAMVNEPTVFKPLKFYCKSKFSLKSKYLQTNVVVVKRVHCSKDHYSILIHWL